MGWFIWGFRMINLKKLKILTFFLVLTLFLINFINAETTFFEGGYFVTSDGEVVILPTGGGWDGGTPSLGCNPLWVCGEWDQCQEGIRTRICTDINQCLVSNEIPPLLLNCNQPLPSDRIVGCVDFLTLNYLISGWKESIIRFDIIDSAINHWKFNLECNL